MHKILFHHFSTNLLHIFQETEQMSIAFKDCAHFNYSNQRKTKKITAQNSTFINIKAKKNGSKMRKKNTLQHITVT